MTLIPMVSHDEKRVNVILPLQFEVNPTVHSECRAPHRVLQSLRQLHIPLHHQCPWLHRKNQMKELEEERKKKKERKGNEKKNNLQVNA